ncbi:endonuclease [Paraburkholderia sp. EG287A]|uniref:endonuclease n=1 Tax=Paraburkholderia sp. EG287A TaxID=3237012 RepID=UPI0034D1EE14
MSILKVASELAKNKQIAAIVTQAKAMPKISASKDDVKAGIDALGLHLRAGKHHDAVSVALALLLWDADGAIARLRRGGLLRPSRYQFQSKALGKVLSAMLAILPQLQVEPERIEYVVSVQCLLSMAPQAERVYKSLIARLRTHQKNVLKSLLAVVNNLFVRNWQPNHEDDSDLLTHWGAEDLTLAFSYIVSLMREQIGIRPKSWQHVDDAIVAMLENVFTSVIIDAAKLNEFREAESFLDCLPYKAITNEATVEISSIDESFEQSVRLGYIQADRQVAIRTLGVVHQMQDPETKTLPTMEEFIAGAFRAGMGELITIVENPVERLAFKMPMEPMFFEPITTDQCFAEEAVVLLGTAIENFRDPEENIRDIRIAPTLTVGDILKVQRFFSFISAAYDERLKEIDDVMRQRLLRLRSVVLVMPRRNWVELLEKILPTAKVEEVLQLITLQENQDYIDVQYRPIIQAGDHLVIAPALLAKSNLPRNIVVSNRLRNALVEAKDPMQEAVVRALTKASFLVRSSFDFNIDGKRETDIFCWRDGHLFVFECKNSYHPCSAHELRTSFGSIEDAEEQLDIRLKWLKDAENQSRLFAALGWGVQPTTLVHTAIVTANRLFNGYRKGNHPVRQAFELMNVLNGGVIRRGDEEPIRFWEGEAFAINDLLAYLDGKSIVQMQLGSLRPYSKTVRLGEAKLEFRRYMSGPAVMGVGPNDGQTAGGYQ